MSLPRGDEYNQAVQNPAICFSDFELKSSQVETTPLGLPKPYSGGFTTTYKLIGTQKKWAVRCFTRDISDLQKRYKSISEFTQSNNCPFLVDAKYLQKGIKIRNNYFPIIKMAWLNGEPLNFYIERVQNDKNKLENLLQEFVSLINRLEKLGIAHGDLQHGNIIVKNDELFLIDYDGMYFPDLSNLRVNELGHPNFQHPRRSSKDYNGSIDRFSAIVIYSAVKALIVDSALWRKYENGDNLLFKATDFTDPQNSSLFKELAGYSELGNLVNNLAAVCTLEFSKTPSLNKFTSSKIASSNIVLPKITSVRSAYLIIDGKQKGKLLEHIGERVEVVGKVGGSYKERLTQYGKPYVFLNFGEYPNQTFTLVIWSDGISSLGKRGISINSFIKKWVSVTGVISTYLGKPQIILESASQIQVLENQNAAQAKLNYKQIPPTPKAISNSKENLYDDELWWDNYLRNKSIPIKQKSNIVKTKATSRENTTPTPIIKNSANKHSSPTPQENENGNLLGPFLMGIPGVIFGAIIGKMAGISNGPLIGFFIGVILGIVLLFLED